MWKFPFYEIDQPVNWAKFEAEFDWFRDMQGVPQDPIWHAEGDVFVHTKMVVEALLELSEFQELKSQEKHILFSAAMLHDVEKRSTTTTEVIDGEERIVSPKHAKRGEFTTRNFLYKELKTPFRIREEIAKLVRWHGLPLWTMYKDDPAKEVIKASLQLNTKLVALLARADVLGRICQDQEEILTRIDFFEEFCKEQDCWGKPRQFPSSYGRFLYLNRSNVSPDYAPYDDTKFEVFMLSAVPGSGKDTYIQKNLKGIPMLSLDEIRRELKIEPTDKKGNGQVIQLGKERAKELMRKKTSFVFNATNVSKDVRSKWISLFTEYGGKVKIIYLEVPYKQVLAQNRNRKYQVPEKVLKGLIKRLEIPTVLEAHEVTYVVENN